MVSKYPLPLFGKPAAIGPVPAMPAQILPWPLHHRGEAGAARAQRRGRVVTGRWWSPIPTGATDEFAGLPLKVAGIEWFEVRSLLQVQAVNATAPDRRAQRERHMSSGKTITSRSPRQRER
jgi:hypothetical protein